METREGNNNDTTLKMNEKYDSLAHRTAAEMIQEYVESAYNCIKTVLPNCAGLSVEIKEIDDDGTTRTNVDVIYKETVKKENNSSSRIWIDKTWLKQ